jgi:hypothetical protein
MRVNPGNWLLFGVAWLHMATIPCFACTMSLPSIPSNEWEIEIETEDYDFDTNMVRYKVEIEVEVFSPTSPAQCKCALNLGSTTSSSPATFSVINATVGLRGEDDVDLAAFDNFTRDSQVENDVASLASFQAGASAFGFSMDVSPFTAPTINPGDLLALVFEIEFNLADYDSVNGSPIQFAAGSNEAGHALSIFNGYQTSLQLPPRSTLPTGDFNGDGDIDGGDFLALQRGFGITENATLQDGDADHDGEVDDDDYKVWNQSFGTAGIEASGVVPEPGSIVLGLLAMIAVTATRGQV